ncbi:leucine--tRNA ligase [Mesosutterella sp. AGMB02718]|uniref:Leucine--tRNA ligase n=1 Tax=Mesosutterella faecium TaxID=2925194 RepID=A0ABT7IJ96_9BURK|nr:leucine--tRNA ligase [Mesosutterella sp. AGMB02718]MDL2058447.1 leucine--tRNA ligase [Mesosutterella sp. AGMB02718]
MRENYSPELVEAEIQAKWKAQDVYRAVEHALDANGREKPKYYVCSMLPYPSGKLHMGHVRNYTLNDVLYRYRRMCGYNVMTPMGWDSFGLPAENAALAKKVPPAKWTYSNIADMKAQMAPLGLAFDWSREVTTCKPEYYRWNQWLFLKMLERGIAYRKTQVVNWDPVDKTVLANEQVIEGRGWRSGAIVEKKEIPGYYLRITQYAQELLDDLDKLGGWPEEVRTMQRHWIGRSEGVDFAFPYTLEGEERQLRVYTTRADTIMGVTFVAVAAEHPLAKYAAKSDPKVAAFIEECAKGGVSEADLATREKKGVKTSLTVRHPLTGEEIPVWVGNYVLMTFGEGAVMGVPAHDERDFAFAKKFGIAIRQAVNVDGVEPFTTDHWQEWYGDKTLNPYCVNSGRFDGLHLHEAIDAVAEALHEKGLGEKKVQFRLRDWSISRQRYWGTPIPMINCPKCGAVPVPEKDLPVILPEDQIPDGSGNPLNKDEAFLNVRCPKCGGPARRETDTMDTFVDSSWYFMRYCCPGAKDRMVDERNDYWMPMDQYIGGIEHAVLHLLYARFWTKVMRDLGLVKFDEPFTRLFTQGMLCAEAFYRDLPDGHKRWYYPDEIEIKTDEKGRPAGAVAKEDGQPVVSAGIQKMSKSKCNVVEPRDIIKKYGADTARTFVMFAGPPDQSAAWSNAGAEGTYRFLKRLWAWVYAHHDELLAARPYDAARASEPEKALRREMYVNVAQATADLDRMQYNTVVSAAMKMMNAIEAFKDDGSEGAAAVLRESMSLLLRVLYPLAPHITTSLWDELGFVRQISELIDAPWPRPTEADLAADEIQLVVQVNGKLRGRIMVPAGAAKEQIEKAALENPDVKRFIGEAPVKRVIIVPKRLVNIVASVPKN